MPLGRDGQEWGRWDFSAKVSGPPFATGEPHEHALATHAELQSHRSHRESIANHAEHSVATMLHFA
jgi:hypothetical protein